MDESLQPDLPAAADTVADVDIDAALSKLVSGGLDREQARATLQTAVDSGCRKTLDEVDRAIGLAGKDVLEVGCGWCWHAPLMIGRGARSYRGLDFDVDLNARTIQDRSDEVSHHYDSATFHEMPVALGEFVSGFRGAQVMKGDIVDAPWPAESFDAVFMLVVTEHVMDPIGMLRRCHDLLRPGGRLYFSHGAYHCWNGHHRPPRLVSEYSATNPDMVAVADWGHLERPLDNNRADQDHLNRIRIHELMAEVSRLFLVDDWKFVESSEATGRDRLTPEIRKRFPQYYREELLTEMVYCSATKHLDAETAKGLDDSLADAMQHHVTLKLGWSHPEQGHCHITRVPTVGNMSQLVLCEDGKPQEPANALHEVIRAKGQGAYSLWGNYLYFSTSDNSDPASNGRQYSLLDSREF
jgi:SAM-dependent methyltransferase